MTRMILCSACKRHVFSGERECPFCKAGIEEGTNHSTETGITAAFSRAERYAIGAAVALTFAATGCSKAEETSATPELANSVAITKAADSANTSESKAAEKKPVEEPRRPDEAPPPSSPFLVGSPAATPDLPVLPAPTATASAAKTPVTTTATVRRPPPPPPPPDDEFDRRNSWHRSHSCTRTPNGQMVCPPYGCVFPDDDCDVLRV